MSRSYIVQTILPWLLAVVMPFFLFYGLFTAYGYLERIEYAEELAQQCVNDGYIILDDRAFTCKPGQVE